MSIYKFRARNHPAADGRVPEPDENCWCVSLELQDEGKLCLELGREDYVFLAAMFLHDLKHDKELAAAVALKVREFMAEKT